MSSRLIIDNNTFIKVLKPACLNRECKKISLFAVTEDRKYHMMPNPIIIPTKIFLETIMPLLPEILVLSEAGSL